MNNREPHIDKNGCLVIPFGCNPKYKYWDGGQSIFATLLELGATDETISRHVDPIHTPAAYDKWMNR